MKWTAAESNEIKYKLSLIYPDKSRDEAVNDFKKSRFKYSIFVFAIVAIIALASALKDRLSDDTIRIKRGDYSEASRSITRKYKADKYDGIIEIDVSNRQYDEQTINKIFERIKNDLPNIILGENESLYAIRKPLNLVRSYEDIIAIRWSSDNDEIVRSDGSINNEDIAEAGSSTTLSYMLQYFEFNSSGTINIKVLPPMYTEAEAIAMAIRHKAISQEKTSRNKEIYELPLDINGVPIRWNENRQRKAFPLLGLAIMLAIAAYFMQEKKLDEAIKKRKCQLLNDYYEIANKLILYISVGVSVKSAFNKMSLEYLEKRNTGEIKMKYAYEELLIMCRQIESGLAEIEAYELCGKRCGLIQYKKLFGYVNQSIKKGSGFVAEKLKNELRESFELRKANAIKEGEEAATKLMLPMLMMLLIVIGVLIIPAFMSFGL